MFDFLVGDDLLSSIIAFGLVLIPAVIIHELGHFLAAKAVGITILEFGIGFPPRVVRLFRWGETEFTLNWIPLGGFVRPLGEDMIRPVSEEETNQERDRLLQGEKRNDVYVTPESAAAAHEQAQVISDNERAELAARGIKNPVSVNEAKPWKRLIFMVAGAAANLLSAYLIFLLIGLSGVEKPIGTRVFLETLEPNSMFIEAGFQEADFLESINGEIFQNSREFFNRLAEFGGQEVTIQARREDSIEPFVRTVLVDVDEAEKLANAEGRLFVTSIAGGSPAEAAGLQAGDYMIGLAGESLADADDPFVALQQLNIANEGREVTLIVLRDGERLELNVTPRINPAPGTGHLGAGVMPEYFVPETGERFANGPDQFEYVPLPLNEALPYAAQQMLTPLRIMVELPGRLISGDAQPEEGRIVSIVGVSQLGGAVLQQSIEQDQPLVLLNFLALISIALGVTQLLPIPPLDGGRILFVLIEMVRGRPIPPEREGAIILIGFAFFLSISVIVIINDIINPLTNLIP